MSELKKILVPVDLSGNSEPAILYASDLARMKSAKIYLLHIAILPDFYVTDLNDYNLYNKELKSAIKKIHDTSLKVLQDIREKYFSATTKVICMVILAINVYKEILYNAEKLQSDFIIMGNGDNYDNIKIGTNTERILYLSNLPVFVVKKTYPFLKTKKVVFASDFSKESVTIFSKVFELINDSKVSFRLLYINTKSKFEDYETVKTRIENFKKNFSADFSVVIRAGKNIETSIVRYAKSINADLIAMGKKSNKGLSQYFGDRITESVIGLSDIPMLVINNAKDVRSKS